MNWFTQWANESIDYMTKDEEKNDRRGWPEESTPSTEQERRYKKVESIDIPGIDEAINSIPEERKKLLIEMMQEDEKNGMYEVPSKEETKLQSFKQILMEVCKANGNHHYPDYDLVDIIDDVEQAAEMYASQFKSQLPIEQKPEEQALVKENAELRKHLLEITEWFDTGCYVDDKAHLMIIKAQKFLNPEKWLATRKGSTETR